MSSYLVLARKYRPQNFSELVGQEILVKTLTNAMRNNRLHHGYILTGIRGVGKTTTARIIAKTLNCLDENALNNAMACGICNNCKLITASHHQDVIEIDAASRTGIDGIREIIDSIAYAPVMAKYKIYIIDEVHMLSNQAFNALLKTLEEPPMNVKFIFATTEIRKVPVTILSRCQRFDLRRLDELEISNHLKNILLKENIESHEDALLLISKASEGSVRDSLSLLDQALAINNHQQYLTTDIVENMLGLVDNLKIIDLLSEIFSGNAKNTMKIFHEIYSLTSDLSQILLEMMEMMHKIIAVKAIEGYKFQAVSSIQFLKIKEFANKLSLATLIKIWQLLTKAKLEIDISNNQKNSFEITLIKLCHAVSILDLQKILLDIKSESSLAINDNVIINPIDSSKDLKINEENNNESEIIAEILRNFPQASLCNI